MFVSSPFRSQLPSVRPVSVGHATPHDEDHQNAWQPVSILAWPPEGDPIDRETRIDAAEPGPITGDPDTYPEGIENVSSF